MYYRKIETAIHTDGTVSKRDLGTVRPDRFDADRAFERRRAANIAQSSGRISSIEEAECGLVVVYTTGDIFVKALTYVVRDG